MSLRVVPATLNITCPEWCNFDAQGHADELWNQGGLIVHTVEDIRIVDTDGFTMPGEDPTPAETIEIGLSVSTTPDNKPQGSPVVFIDGRQVTIAQAELMAAALRDVIAFARDASQ
jgi:hypothetical protein